MQKVKTRHSLTALSLATTLLAVSCAGAQTPTSSPTSASPAQTATAAPPTTAAPPVTTPPATTPPGGLTGTLSVLEWSGYEDPLYWADFQAAHPQATVDFSFDVSDADIYGKVKAGDQSDVFHPYTGWLQFYVDEGLVEELDTSRLSNWDKVPDSFKAVGQINGKQYFVPFDWGFSSILYRTDKIEGEIDSWAALFDEQYAGHISMWDDGPAAASVSSYVHGYDAAALTDEQLAAIQQEWVEQAPLNFAYWASEYGDLVPWVQSGDVWLAYSWQGAYATLLAEGVPVAYADPIEGRNSWVGVYGIRKGTTNLDLAYAFLDGKLGSVTGNNLVTNFYYGSANGEVMASITDETLKEAFSIDDPTVLERTNFTPNLTAAQRDAWTQMWAEVKAGP